jgi:hypothetical protein
MQRNTHHFTNGKVACSLRRKSGSTGILCAYFFCHSEIQYWKIDPLTCKIPAEFLLCPSDLIPDGGTCMQKCRESIQEILRQEDFPRRTGRKRAGKGERGGGLCHLWQHRDLTNSCQVTGGQKKATCNKRGAVSQEPS